MASQMRRTDRLTLLQTALDYLNTALSSVAGMKVLLVDADVRVALNLVSTHTELLRHEVVFVDVLDHTDRPDLRYLPCVVFARPTAETIRSVSHELEHGRFSEFHLFFTNIVDTDHLQAITNADTRSIVKTFQEVYFDYLPVVDDTVLLRLGDGTKAASAKIPLALNDWTNSDFSRVCHGLVSVMLASKRRPVIRYRAQSKVCARIAAEIGAKMRMINTTFFDLRARGTLLLICDRCDDPVTPLLTQWTYEAMMHEQFGIQDGIVDLSKAAGAKTAVATPDDLDDAKQVLTAQHDFFFASHRDSDWGELCTSVRDLIEAYKSLHQIDFSTASMHDIKEFMGRFPEAKSQSTVMMRHAAIVSKLGDAVMGNNLVDVSTIEQELACGPSAPNDHARLVLDAISKRVEAPEAAAPPKPRAPAAAPASTPAGASASTEGQGEAAAAAPPPPPFAYQVFDVVKLVLLYTLRYEKAGKEASIMEMNDALQNVRGAGARYRDFMDKYLRFGGAAQRMGQLYPKSPGMLKNMVKAISGFGAEMQNVLTQHVPLLRRYISQAQNGTLPVDHFPIHAASASQCDDTTRFNDVIVFMAGGATYEEARLVTRINRGEVENDPATFPPGAEVLGDKTAGADTRPTAGGVAAVSTQGVLNAGRALAQRFTRHDDAAENPEQHTDGTLPVTKKLECSVRLVANGMLRAADLAVNL